MATSTLPNTVNNMISNLKGSDLPLTSSNSTKVDVALSRQILKENMSDPNREIVSMSYNWTSTYGDHIRFVTKSGNIWYIKVTRVT